MTEEERRQAGCSAGRMQLDFHRGLLDLPPIAKGSRQGTKFPPEAFVIEETQRALRRVDIPPEPSVLFSP